MYALNMILHLLTVTDEVNIYTFVPITVNQQQFVISIITESNNLKLLFYCGHKFICSSF